MATTHVFIVDTTTFKFHLEYSFAGTGAKDSSVDFNNSPNTQLNHITENNLLSMIADSQRVRCGDYIIFYLQQNVSMGVYEGKFYGLFRAVSDFSFLDNNDDGQFLKEQLGKSLTFRTKIEPFQVYAKGVTEWEALDEIKFIHSPYQMLWSLIYRKLKGNRGNTMITIYESERLIQLIRDKNNRQIINSDDFTFNSVTQEIAASDSEHTYLGRSEQINIFPRLENKYICNKAFESHLQVYILQNIGRNTNESLDDCLLENMDIEWLGNEVSCGVGMQRIDIAISLIQDNIRIIQAIELKAVIADIQNIIQIQRYVDWLQQYYLPNRASDIQPTLVAKKMPDKIQAFYTELVRSFNIFNEKNIYCKPLKYIEYEIRNNQLFFSNIDY